MVKTTSHIALSYRYIALLACLLVLGATAARAQSTGKISGTVVDATNGESLPGVNVYLEERPELGSITDAEGRYFLLSVPPGRYTLVMSFIGFATLKQDGVEVFSGRTTTVDGRIRQEVIQGEEVIVTAERPIVVRDRTSTVSFVTQESLEKLPVLEVGDVVRYQPGVVAGSDGGLHFRGGRTRETAYIVDGIPMQDVFNQGGGNTIDIEVQSVQELQVYTGTFDAEHGGAQSGIVSVTTRDPGRRLEGSFRALAGGFYDGNDNLFIDGNAFSPGDTKDFTLTLSGPILKQWENVGFFFTGRYEDRVGYLKGERRFTSEDGFTIDTYRRWYRDVYQPGDTRLIALDTARTPTGELILDRDGNPITFATGGGEVVSMDWRRSWTLNPKLVLRPSARSHLAYTAVYNNREGQGFSNGSRYAPDNRGTGYSNTFTNILTFKQTFGNNKVWNLRGSYKRAEDEFFAFENVTDPGIQYIGASDETTGFSLGSTNNGRSRSSERQVIVSSDFLWQINQWNEFKAGFQYRRNRFIVEDLDRVWVDAANPDSLFRNLTYPDVEDYPIFADYLEAVRGRLPVLRPEAELLSVPELADVVVDDNFDQAPVELAVFAQNKLEFDSRLVVKSGLRFEYFDVGEKRLIEPRTPTDRIGRADNFEDTPAKVYLSPRIGISYPISERGAFRVAYGHFVQMPAYREMLKNPIFSSINVGRLENRSVGNPDLDPERTIKYEMGLQQQITDFIGVDINLFYKNIRNLLGTEIISTLDNVLYTRTVNRDYGLVRGGTFAIVTRPVGILLGTSFDVTYSDARGSSSNSDDVANVVIAGRSGEVGEFFLERNVAPLNWDQTWTANLSANLGRANNWSVGFIGQLASGQPFTPTFLDPNKNFPANEFENSERKPLLLTFDINAEKRFQVGRAAYGIRLQINNLFNHLNELVVDSISGRAGDIIRLPVVQRDRDLVTDYVGLFSRAEDDTNPQWYSAPRQILLALTMNF